MMYVGTCVGAPSTDDAYQRLLVFTIDVEADLGHHVDRGEVDNPVQHLFGHVVQPGPPTPADSQPQGRRGRRNEGQVHPAPRGVAGPLGVPGAEEVAHSDVRADVDGQGELEGNAVCAQNHDLCCQLLLVE